MGAIGITVLVCGGRAITGAVKASLLQCLDTVHSKTPIAKVVHGACPNPNEAYRYSADLVGQYWALGNGVEVVGYPADWQRYGRSAGPKRNTQMLDMERIDLVVAAPGGTGTADMCRQAKARGVRVLRGSAISEKR